MSAGDEYNAYRNDVIDSYEKERKTEHRGTKLGDAYDDTTPGIFNNNILITRMELANGLTFKSNFTYTENGTTKTEENFLNVLFDGYGTYTNGNTKPKAIRVWSGNDHWLLTKASALQYLYVIPVEKEVNQDTCFDILYWNDTYQNLKTAINDNTLLKQGHAYLYHDGNALSGGSSGSVPQILASNQAVPGNDMIDSGDPQVDPSANITVQNAPGEQVLQNPSDVKERGEELQTNLEASNESFQLNQVWENIEDIYLIKAPIHQHFALAPDEKRLPFYGGTYRIVYKNGDTQDIPTFSTLTYFYSMKEVRTCQIPTVVNPTDFDWFSHENEQYRHIPMVVIRPTNPETRIRVLDSLDSGVITSIDVIPDIYYAELNSKKMCSYQVEEGFTVEEEPSKKELNFTDKVFDISGFKVSYIYRDGNSSRLIYCDADAGTLYVKNPDITDDEYTKGNEKLVVSREVYAKIDVGSSSMEKLVTTLSYPVSEATMVDVIAASGVSIPGTGVDPLESEETVSDEEGALAVTKAQKEFGANEEPNVESTSYFSLQYNHQNDLYASVFNRLKKKIGEWFRRKKEEIKAKREQLKEELKQKVRSAALQGLDSVVQRIKSKISNTALQSLALGETVEVKTSIQRYMYSNHIVPPLPQNVQSKYQNNLGVIPWPLILKYGQMILPFALRGIKTLLRKITKKALSKKYPNVSAIAHGYTENGIPFIYEEKSEWIDSPANGVCADAVITGYNPDTSSTSTLLPVKILSQGQAFNIVLHHPSTVSAMSSEVRAKTLIGIRCIQPPITNQMGYGENYGSSATGSTEDAGEWVGVNANNEDVTPNQTLTIANGGIICPAIKWTPNTSRGTVEQEVQMTLNGLQRFKSLGYSVAPHMLSLHNGEEDGVFSGILSLYNRGRRFAESHPRLTELTKRGISWTIGRLMERTKPYTKKDTTVGELPGVGDDDPIQESDLVNDTSVSNALPLEKTNDSSIDDESFLKVVAVQFDGNYPSRKDITLNNLEKYFQSAKVCLLYEDDEEYTGSLGTGLSRTYLEDGEFVPSTNLARDILEFGTSIINIRGISFSLGTSGTDILNAIKYPDYKLVLSQSPQRVVYTFGDKRMDLTGAIWNLVNSSGKVIIDGLTEENLIVEDLPTNIEECQLEVNDRNPKTKIRVHFLGFTNDELEVTLLHPYIVALEEQNHMDTISKATAYNLIALKGFKAPKMVLCTRVWPNTGENANWPSSPYTLMTRLKAALVLRDTFMRRKIFEVGTDISESLFNKIYTIEDYNSSSTSSYQQITINCMGHTVKKYISLEAIGNTNEEDLDDAGGSITASNVTATPPGEDYGWDGTDPDGSSYATATGSGVELEENENNEIMRACRRIIAEMKGIPISDHGASTILPNDSLFTHGKTQIESVFSEEISSYYRQSTGLTHHAPLSNLDGFFKKLWKKIKKAAKWVYKKVLKPAGKFVGGVVKTVVETASSVVGGALGSLTGGVAGAGETDIGGGEYVPMPAQTVYYKPSDVLGSNQEILVSPMMGKNSNSILNGKVLPWRGCVIKPYYDTGSRTNKLTRVWGSLRRFAGAFTERNPIAVPGITNLLASRRIANNGDPFPSKLFTTNLTTENGESVFFDSIEMISINTFDENTEMLTNSSSLSGMTFYPYSFCMSSADLSLGDTWPTIEEVQMITTLYAQRTRDLKWVAIPFSHSAIQIQNYSNTDDSMEQLVTITLTIGTTVYTTYAIFYRSSSNLKIVQKEDQVFVWLFQHPYASGGSYIAYLGERRHNGTSRTSETEYTEFNYKIADQVKLVDAENRKVLSIQDYGDGAESMHWENSTSIGNTILGNFKISKLDESQAISYMLYAFTYTTSGEYVEIKVYDDSLGYYVSKDGILYQYDSTLGGMVIVGYDPETTSTTATIRKVVKIVENFSE